MDGFGAAFDATHVQAAVGEVDGIPAQCHRLGHPQPMPIGDQHDGRLPMAVAVMAGGSDQAINLIDEVLARAELGVALAPRRARPFTVGGATSARCGLVMVLRAFPHATARI
jgi:hypothetical protein